MMKYNGQETRKVQAIALSLSAKWELGGNCLAIGGKESRGRRLVY
jgi:hypothetical protein